MTKGQLIIISGFSGSGKSTITKQLLEKYSNYALSVSATTRSPREGEKEGIDYFFKTEEEFLRMVNEDAFLEYAYYVDHAYGTPMAYVDEQLESGKDVILEIEIQGALKVKDRRPDTILIFITPPDAEELARRLTSRGTDSEDVIRSRLRQAIEDFTAALQQEPNLGEAYFNRAICYLNSGDKEKARSDLSKAGELGLYDAYSVLKRQGS